MRFPRINGYNLETKKYNIPDDLEGEFNIIIVPFQRWQQELVDQWVLPLEEILLNYKCIRLYEIPTLSKGYLVMRSVIDGGMRAGIPEKGVRERTITIYVDKGKFKLVLGIKSEDTVYLYFINKNGDILWQSQGSFTNFKGQKLSKFLKSLKIN